MRVPMRLLFGLLIAMSATMLHAGETVTVGGAVVPIPAGWTQSAQDNGVVLSPPDLPQGVVCTFTLLGGETFDGVLIDRLRAEWKEFEKLGRVIEDDGGKVSGTGGPIVTASHSGRIEIKQGVEVSVWVLITSANGRIERMVYVTTGPETFAKYGGSVAAMINGIKYIVPKAGAPVELGKAGTFGGMKYDVPAGWREKRSESQVVLSPDNPRNEMLEVVLMPAKEFTGTLVEALAASWDEAAELSHLSKTRTVNGVAYATQAPRTSFKGWDYIRGDGYMTSAPGANDYIFNLTVIRIDSRIERVLIRSKQNFSTLHNRRYSLYEAPTYRRETLEFIFSLRFDGFKEPKVEPGTLKGEGIIGVWNGSSMFGTKLQPSYAIFFSNGQVYFSNRFPFRGCYEFNTWVDAEEVPQFWGTYQFKDGKGSIQLGKRDIAMRTKDSELLVTTQNADQRFFRLPPVDGAKFDGNYAFQEWNHKIPSIRLTPDGHFDDRGALNILRLEVSYPFSATDEPGGGTYTFKDYTLLLDYTDGRKYRIAFPGLWAYDSKIISPDSLYMGYGDQELKKR